MLFLDHTQVQYCKLLGKDKTISGINYNGKAFVRVKAFPKEELEAAIKECREEYLDHEERSKIPTLLIKEKNGVGIWMQNNNYKLDQTSNPESEKHSASESVSATAVKSKTNVNRISVRQLALEMRSENGVEVKTRRHKLKLYQRCFLGNEAVDWITKKVKISRLDAVQLGQQMLDKGICCHVLDEHQFKDEPVFYRFSEDDGKSIWNSSI